MTDREQQRAELLERLCPTCGERADGLSRQIGIGLSPAWLDPCGHFVTGPMTTESHPVYGDAIRHQDLRWDWWELWRMSVGRSGRPVTVEPPLEWMLSMAQKRQEPSPLVEREGAEPGPAVEDETHLFDLTHPVHMSAVRELIDLGLKRRPRRARRILDEIRRLADTSIVTFDPPPVLPPLEPGDRVKVGDTVIEYQPKPQVTIEQPSVQRDDNLRFYRSLDPEDAERGAPEAIEKLLAEGGYVVMNGDIVVGRIARGTKVETYEPPPWVSRRDRILAVLAEHIKYGYGACSCGEEFHRRGNYSRDHREHLADVLDAELDDD